jgi:predicted ATPase
MEELVEIKINEASSILKDLGLPQKNQNRVAALTLLALCNLKPHDQWESALRQSMTLSKDIMEFVNVYYHANYKANTRESFRNMALKPFVENNIAELNPDNPDLEPTSSKTHYAIATLALNTIRKYNTSEWKITVENFIKFNSFLIETKQTNALLKNISIIGYKSIVDDEIELGRFNVFIGANGSGKTNVLESLATVGAAKANDLNLDGLYSRGVRMARPDLIISSFSDARQRTSIDINLSFSDREDPQEYRFSLSPVSQKDIYTKWVDLAEEELYPDVLLDYFREITISNPAITGNELLEEVNKLTESRGLKQNRKFDNFLIDYAIFDLNTKSLRGISTDSKKTPLGINGEGLDILIANLNKADKEYLNKCKQFFDWLDEIIADKEDKLKPTGLKPGKSISTLYFTDKFMQKNNNIFSAENSNEGVLHVLFYLALMISEKAPKLFAIDNIETALNPRLCKTLIETLVDLSKSRGKQVLVTTHNPAILDGLNLFDDEQRLFDVYRDDNGHTKTRRIKFKSDLSDKKYKLSEMWMSGLLGAIPRNF